MIESHGTRQEGFFFIHVWAECVIHWQSVYVEARDDPGREGREGGGAAPQDWACSIGGGEDASRWESVSVSGGAPGLISLPRTQHAARSSGLGSMEQRSLQRGEVRVSVSVHWLRCAIAVCFSPINTLSRASYAEGMVWIHCLIIYAFTSLIHTAVGL